MIGEVVSLVIGTSIYKISADGEPIILPGVGRVTYNIRVGDLATRWMTDHVEPEVTTLFTSKTGAITPVTNPDANIAKLMKLRNDI